MTHTALCADMIAYGASGVVLRNKCVEIKNGVIASITSSPSGARVYDYRGHGTLLVPSAIDLHVHLRGLRLSAKEDAFSGTAAAARGGVSVVVDMPNTDPPLKSVGALEWKLEELSRDALVDYGVYAGLPSSTRELSRLLRMPVVGVKLYPEDYSVLDCGKVEALAGKLLIVHPELPDLARDYSEDALGRAMLRGCHAEAAAVGYIADTVKACAGGRAGPRVHITHASCPSTVVQAKRYGFTVDTTLHYILSWELLSHSIALASCYTKVNPPLRIYTASTAMYHLVLSGEVDAVASDHAPHTPREKSLDPLICPPGIASLELWPSILLRLALRQKDLSLYIRLAAWNPARLLGLRRLGVVEEGFYASLAVYRLEEDRIYELEYSKARYTPLTVEPGLQLEHHMVRGTTAYTAETGINTEARGMNIAVL